MFDRTKLVPLALLLTTILLGSAPGQAFAQGDADGFDDAAEAEVDDFDAAPDLPDLSAMEADEDTTPAPGKTGADGFTAWEIIQFGGIVGYIIIGLSFITLALVIEYAITIRRGRLMPKKLVNEMRELINAQRFEEAAKRAQGERSFVGYVLARGLHERDRGYEAMVKAMEDSADEATGTRLRRVEHLNIIGNISPMLGLLGTVLGMTTSFNQISQSVGGVDPRLLAGGIFQALVTTVMGLVVAIPALYFYSMFRNRLDALISEATLEAEHMTEVFKRLPGGAAAQTAATPSPEESGHKPAFATRN